MKIWRSKKSSRSERKNGKMEIHLAWSSRHIPSPPLAKLWWKPKLKAPRTLAKSRALHSRFSTARIFRELMIRENPVAGTSNFADTTINSRRRSLSRPRLLPHDDTLKKSRSQPLSRVRPLSFQFRNYIKISPSAEYSSSRVRGSREFRGSRGTSLMK